MNTKNSMMSYKRVFHVVALLLMALSAVGCATEVDYAMGEEFVPSQQQMELKRRIYEGGVYRDNGSEVECPLTTTRLYHTDSIRSSNIKYGYFGSENSEEFGNRRAGFMSQMIFSLSLPEGRGWGYRPIYDSMLLSLYITDFKGDTTKRYRFNVYEITSNDYLSDSLTDNGAYYINFEPADYISKEPIFTFEFPNQEKGAYVGDKSDPQPSNVRLESTAATEAYIKRLMLLTDKSGNPISDTLALDHDGIYETGNEEAFLEYIKGIYIAPAEETEGIMFATELENTALLLYTRSRYEEDPTIIRDTTYMVYNLYLDPTTYDLPSENISINSVKHDFSATLEANLQKEQLATCYVDGMGGVVTEVEFTDEFIQSLADIVYQAGEGAVVSVNNATMSVYLEGADYDFNKVQVDPGFITPLLNSSMIRMGCYTDYIGLEGVTDYVYTIETSSNPLVYDGYLNRSLACYKMNISLYIQSLMKVASEYTDSSGKVDFESFAQDSDYNKLRKFYLAPAAYSLYGFNRQAIYGMDGEVDGERAVAPIKLDLTYTIVD